MGTQQIKIDDIDGITIYHSSDMCAAYQLGLWYDVKTRVHILPCKLFGLVAITPKGAQFAHGQPLYAYLVYRPVCLELEFDHKVKSELVSVPSERLQAWYKSGKPWVSVKPKRAAT